MISNGVLSPNESMSVREYVGVPTETIVRLIEYPSDVGTVLTGMWEYTSEEVEGDKPNCIICPSDGVTVKDAVVAVGHVYS